MVEIEMAAAGIAVIAALQEGNGGEAESIYREKFGGPPLEIVRRAPRGDGFIPPFMVCRKLSRVDVFCTGVQNRGDARLFGLGYQLLGEPPFRYFSNTFAWNCAKLLVAAAGHLFREERVFFFGHSAGGCTCELVASYLEDRFYAGTLGGINTYGAPSAGHSSVYPQRFRNEGRQRWMAYGDPVPFIPQFIPSDRTQQTGLLLITAAGNDITRNVQPPGGLRLSWNGITPGSFPAGVPHLNAGVNNWINREPAELRLHSADAYVSLLNRHVNAAKLEVEIVPDALPQLRHEVPTVPQFVGRVIAIIGGYAPATREGPNVVLPIDMSRLVPPSGVGIAAVNAAGLQLPNGQFVPASFRERNMAQARVDRTLRFFVVKVGQRWCVGWMDLIIATYRFPSAAKTVASAGNRFLRLLGNRGGVNMPDFADVWSTFVDLASTSGRGYRPPLQVNP